MTQFVRAASFGLLYLNCSVTAVCLFYNDEEQHKQHQHFHQRTCKISMDMNLCFELICDLFSIRFHTP